MSLYYVGALMHFFITSRVAGRCTGEKAASASTYEFLHYPVKSEQYVDDFVREVNEVF